jgi:uncharacterized protein YndB with AHSA1/START domain
MASIRREVILDAPVETVWEALRDVGELHTRLVPGFVVDCRLDGEARVVTIRQWHGGARTDRGCQ